MSSNVLKHWIQTLSINEVETIEVIRVILFVKNIGVQNMMIEGDSLTTMWVLQETTPDASKIGHLIDETKKCKTTYKNFESNLSHS